jgi:1-acyl-sn-glycerol-3-phosphate acyltransferase
MRLFLAAVRFFAFFVVTLGCYAIWFAGAFFVTGKSSWQRVIFRLWSRAFVKMSRIKIEVVGQPPQPPFFLVSNHLSYVDIPVLRAVAEGVFITKKDIEGWFGFGKIVRDLGMIFINRENRRDIPRAGAEVLKKLNAGEGVIVFPEGTSSKGETILKFNSSFLEFPARNDFPVHYVSITYRTPDNNPPANSVCWWKPEDPFIGHLWKLFQIPEFEATLTFGDEPLQSKNRKELARKLWEKVNERFVPVL